MASVSTRDHTAIRRWAEEHDARPVLVSRADRLLRFEFDQPPEFPGLGWDEFFQVFDQRGLELVYDDRPGSRLHKLAYPEAKPAAAARPPRMTMQPTAPIRRPGVARPAAQRKRAAKRARLPVRLAGGSAAGRVTVRSSKAGKPAGKTTRKAASHRPSRSRRAA